MDIILRNPLFFRVRDHPQWTGKCRSFPWLVASLLYTRVLSGVTGYGGLGGGTLEWVSREEILLPTHGGGFSGQVPLPDSCGLPRLC